MMPYLGMPFEGALPFLMIPIVFYIVIFWELIWKGIALWNAGGNKQLAWFIAILLINSFGILPIIYLLFFKKKKVKKSRKK